MTPTPTPIMDGLIDATDTVVSSGISWLSSWASAITGNTLLIVAVVAVPLCGLGVGLLARLMRKKV